MITKVVMVKLTLHGDNNKLQFGNQTDNMAISGNKDVIQFEGGHDALMTIERDGYEGAIAFASERRYRFT